MSKPSRPRSITPFPNGEIGVAWDDGHESYFRGFDLRAACACAHCVDEMSGERILDVDSVSQDVAARRIYPVGNYGISIEWSDGHDQGIYPFRRLREMCPCAACAQQAEGG